MGRHGPCLHCGIEHTVLWRAGPPEKTCLCNACGTWWRTKGSLGDYIPRHGIHEQSSLIHQRRAMPVKEVTNNQSGSGLVESIQNSCPDTRLPAAAKDKVKGFSIFSFKVPRRKRSELPQYCLTGIGRLHRQLLEIQDEQQSEANTSVAGEEENDVLIDNTNWMHDVWK